jgi:predicted dienelactone hydrolase
MVKSTGFFGACCFLGASLLLASDGSLIRDRSNLLRLRDERGEERPIKTGADWARRRGQILAGMQEVMGQLPDDNRKVPLDVRVGEEVTGPFYVRRKLTYAAEKGDRVPAYLLIPVRRGGKLPAVLCLHQTGIGKAETVVAGQGDDNLHYAAHLAERGYVALAPDYPSFGEYRYDFRSSSYKSGSMKAVWNNMRAIDLLQALPEVDGERIGCIGHSLGGHNTMFTAAFDTRIQAAVSNCGFTSFPKYYKGNLTGWTSDRYMPLIKTRYDNRPDKVPFDFPELVATLAPRAFLAIAPVGDDNFEVSGVKDCIAAAMPVYDLLGAKDRLAARYPDCKHAFPPEMRKVAYKWLDRWLKPEATHP